MILVDPRTGSRELLDGLRNLGADARIADGELASDFEFTGCGADGTILVGVERKTIQDLVNSMRDHRLAGSQLIGMTQTYDEIYVLVEGIWRRQRESGMVEYRNGGWHTIRGQVRYSEVDSFLCSLEATTRDWTNLHVWRTQDQEETCAAVVDRFHWWQKPWEEHTSVSRSIYAPVPQRPRKGTKAAMRHDPTLLEKWLADLPGIDSRWLDLAPHFRSARDMANADVERWLGIKGMRIGQKTAENIVQAVTQCESRS